VGRPAQRTQGSVPENQFRRPHPDLHGGRLTEILEPLPEPRESSTAPAREEEYRAAGSSSTRPRWTIIRRTAPHRRPSTEEKHKEPLLHVRSTSYNFLPISTSKNHHRKARDRVNRSSSQLEKWTERERRRNIAYIDAQTRRSNSHYKEPSRRWSCKERAKASVEQATENGEVVQHRRRTSYAPSPVLGSPLLYEP
jgi:hypothetical protein